MICFPCFPPLFSFFSFFICTGQVRHEGRQRVRSAKRVNLHVVQSREFQINGNKTPTYAVLERLEPKNGMKVPVRKRKHIGKAGRGEEMEKMRDNRPQVHAMKPSSTPTPTTPTPPLFFLFIFLFFSFFPFFFSSSSSSSSSSSPSSFRAVDPPGLRALQTTDHLALNKHRVAFVEPKVFPLGVGHQVAAPAVCNFMGHHVHLEAGGGGGGKEKKRKGKKEKEKEKKKERRRKKKKKKKKK